MKCLASAVYYGRHRRTRKKRRYIVYRNQSTNFLNCFGFLQQSTIYRLMLCVGHISTSGQCFLTLNKYQLLMQHQHIKMPANHSGLCFLRVSEQRHHLIEQVWSGAWHSALLTSSQVVAILLVPRPHFE